MDPNANLKEVRELVEKSIYGAGLTPDEANRLCDLIECLDDWLSHGGFLPQDWQAKR